MSNPRQTLKAYASGSGCLSLVWVYKHSGECSSRKVTLSQAKRFLKTREGKHLGENHWIVTHDDSNRVILVKMVYRIDDNHLRMYDHERECVYRLEHINKFEFKLWFDVPELGREMECVNWSTRAVVRYFLDNERWLKLRYQERENGSLCNLQSS